MADLSINNTSFCDIDEHTVAWDDYHSGVAVDDHFYKHYEADE